MRRVTDKDIPKLNPWVGSWVLIRKSTGEVIGEVHRDNKASLKGLNADNVQIVPADVHLASLTEQLNGGDKMIMYEADSINIHVSPVEVRKQTEQFVYIGAGGRRYAKLTFHKSYFETSDQAKDWLRGEVMRELDIVNKQLQRAQHRISKVNKL